MSVVKFKGKLNTVVCPNDGFKVYGMKVDKRKYKDIKFNIYNNVTIVGDLPELEFDVEYTIEGTEKNNGKFGYQYVVSKIYRDKPITTDDSRKFLSEVLTDRQAKVLLEVYPDIIDRIINNKEVDLTLTKGVKEASFKKIRDKVIKDFCLMDLINEYAEYGMTLTMIRNLYSHYTSIERVKEEMDKNPYNCLCKLNNVGFVKADEMILKIKQDLRVSRQRCASCMMYFIVQNELEGSTFILKQELFNRVYNLVGAECAKYFDEVIMFSRDLYLENNKIANRRTYECEKYIAKSIKELLSNNSELDIDVSKYAEINGFKLTEEQLGTPRNFCKYNISMLLGAGGTGKSASIQALIKLMEDNDISYALGTPTGASAEVLSTYVKREAKTIHRLLRYKKGKFVYNENNKLDVDAVIIDEVTMVDVFLMKALLSAIDTSRTRVLFVQDIYQLASVACGNCSYDMLNSGKIPTTELTKVFRYEDGGMAKVITDVRYGKMFTKDDFDTIKHFGQDKDYTLVKVSKDTMVQYACRIFQEFLKRGDSIKDTIVISAMNKNQHGTIEINKLIQSAVNPPSQDKKEVVFKNTTYREGDRVMQIRNNYEALTIDDEEEAIFNGNQGIIEKIENKYVIVKFNSGKEIVYSRDDLEDLMLSYAVSTHKMQGNSSKNIIYVCPSSHTYMTTRNLMYTALSRSKKKIFHLVENLKIFHVALNKVESEQRNTFLLDMIKCDII